MKESKSQPALHGLGPSLKEMVQDTSAALIRLDVRRLEELALACSGPEASQVDLIEARDVEAEVRKLARLLEVTRTNAEFMERLRSMGAEQLEYCEHHS